MARKKRDAEPAHPLRLEYRSPEELADNPKNWRRHPDEQLAALEGAIAEVGWAGACLYNERTGRLIDGHARRKIALKQGGKVPVLVGSWDEATESKILSTLDPLAAMATPDPAALDLLLREVNTGCGELQQMLDDLWSEAQADAIADTKPVDEDEPPFPPAVPVTRPGDVWVMGRHRLLCGDCRKPEDVARVMAGEKAVLLATDPPYGVDFAGAKYNPRAKAWDGIANDRLQGADLKNFMSSMFAAWLPHIDETAAFYFWTVAMEEGAAAAAAAIRDAGLHIQAQIIWNKNCLVLGQADYQWKHENCWYAFWKGKHHRWFGGRDKTTVWDVSKVANSDYEHPMQKPVELYAIPIRHHTKEGELVADPFCGSGSQIIAAEELGRACYGMEINQAFVDVAVQRWCNKTEQDATRESDGASFRELSAKSKR